MASNNNEGQSILNMDEESLASMQAAGGYVMASRPGATRKVPLTDFGSSESGSAQPECFIEPIIYPGNAVPAMATAFQLANIENGHSAALIALRAPSAMQVKAGDVYELMFNAYANINSYPISLALFKLVGHPCSNSAPIKFRRLTTPIAPRALTGICNDYGIGANGNPSQATDPVRFTFEEDVTFDADENIYVGMALAYSSDYGVNCSIMSAPLKSVYQYNDPSQIVMPVYYIFGTSDKIDTDGFSAKEITAGFGGPASGYDFNLSTGYGDTVGQCIITSSGIQTSSGVNLPVQMKLKKYNAT